MHSATKEISVIQKVNFFVIILITAIVASAVITYLQKTRLTKKYQHGVNQKIELAKSEWTKAVENYTALLSLVGKNITKREIATDHVAISAILEQVHKNKDDNGHLLNRSIHNKTLLTEYNNLFWQSTTDNIWINRHGVFSGNFLSNHQLRTNIEKYLVVFDQVYLHMYTNPEIVPAQNELYFIFGVKDKRTHYIGKLATKFNIKKWIEDLGLEPGYDLFIINDNSKNILFSNDDKISLKNLSNKLVATNYFNLSDTYRAVIGYDKAKFNEDWLVSCIPLLEVIWASAIAFILGVYAYTNKLRNDIRIDFITDLNALKTSYQNKSEKAKHLLIELNNQTKALIDFTRQQDDLSKLELIGLRAREQLKKELGNEIAVELANIRETIKLIDGNEEREGNAPNINNHSRSQLIANVSDTLAYLSIFCVTAKNSTNHNNQENIDLQKLCDEVVRIYTKEIYISGLQVAQKVKTKVKSMSISPLLIKQLLANLLRERIANAKTDGHIEILMTSKKVKNTDMLSLAITDNGYVVSDAYLDQNESNCDYPSEKYNKQGANNLPTSPLDLNLESIKLIADSYGGNLELIRNNKLNVIILLLPCNLHNNKDNKNTTLPSPTNKKKGGLVVLFKRS